MNSELGIVASSVVLPCQLSGRTGTPTSLEAQNLNVGFLQYEAGVFFPTIVVSLYSNTEILNEEYSNYFTRKNLGYQNVW